MGATGTWGFPGPRPELCGQHTKAQEVHSLPKVTQGWHPGIHKTMLSAPPLNPRRKDQEAQTGGVAASGERSAPWRPQRE